METGLSALRGASLDNIVYMFGEALLSPHSSNHTIIFSGGQASDYTTINRIWRFNARNQTWEREGTMQHGRFYHAVSVVRVKDFCHEEEIKEKIFISKKKNSTTISDHG